jgi:outer membrane lipoprotein-sorting protein
MKKVALIFSLVFSASAFVPDSFTTDYEQKAKKKIGKGYRVATGTFEYQYPGNLKVSQVAPDELIYVSNKTKTWIYRPPFDEGEKAEVMIHKGQEASLSSFFDILKSGLKSNKHYKVVAKKSMVSLNFKKAAVKKTGVSKADLTFTGKRKFSTLKKIHISYKDGREVILNLSKLKAGVKFKKDHFVFDVPKNANVTYQ